MGCSRTDRDGRPSEGIAVALKAWFIFYSATMY